MAYYSEDHIDQILLVKNTKGGFLWSTAAKREPGFIAYRSVHDSGFVLRDFLAKELKVVFVGTAPSDVSAAHGHYYANPNNSFWDLLYQSGFTDRKLRPCDDYLVLEYRIGLTDVLKFEHSGDDSRLSRLAFQEGAVQLRERLI
ncbi:MAG: mismatch-specific DNA-glycosylase, partial [Firmicutes bacterium]|nr:mismatch-specific DNA-glycosylase [Bacillota bacterium]